MDEPLPSFAFGDTLEAADALLALVRAGKKTATCSALRAYPDAAALPQRGQRFQVLDSRGVCGCIIEVTQVVVRPFHEVDASFALLEGEGDGSLAYWRQEHRAFFTRAGYFDENMDVVCEYFRVVAV